MKKIAGIVILFMLSTIAAELPQRPLHTFSIVARDSATGEIGVAVQSHWFSVGSDVCWAEAGVGAVATQSFIDPAYGPLGLALMRNGKSAPEALQALLSVDPHADVRQVAMVDAMGNVAVHTGKNCLFAAGHVQGPGYACQANMMEKTTVWNAMAKAYETASGDLLDRLMAALEAAQREGGDIRGQQSAAILIVPGSRNSEPWKKVADLRVDDSPNAVAEMKRLIIVHRAYEHMNRGDELMTQGDLAGALAEYAAAEKLYPQNIEIPYWTAVGLVNAGRLAEALPIFARIFRQEPRWKELTRRLKGTDLLMTDEAGWEKIFNADR
ncbi:MAG: DUF1028 domain-containing protein [candidate division KSB1 bacterium]|nr:DUF1028 domain-containing protein [candidate division KSB1 bacterium]MDZ7346140.1 DUF1028 domain-containing protein [candidate division KSB1 bacterium]